LSRKNSLGDTGVQSSLGVNSDTLYVYTEAPEFAKGPTFNVVVTRDQSNSTTTANATLEILIKANGGKIRIPTSTSAFWFTRELSSTTTPSNASVAVSEVRDSSNNLISPVGGYYEIPVNQTYKFVLQDSYAYPGAGRIRYKVTAIDWLNSAGIVQNSNWTSRDLLTDWSN
jgi:hypothetical protein